jgi:hypothetical protein
MDQCHAHRGATLETSTLPAWWRVTTRAVKRSRPWATFPRAGRCVTVQTGASSANQTFKRSASRRVACRLKPRPAVSRSRAQGRWQHSSQRGAFFIRHKTRTSPMTCAPGI